MPPRLPLYAFLYVIHSSSGTTTWAPGLSTDETLYNLVLAYENDPDVEFPSFKTTGFGDYAEEAKKNMMEVDGEHGGIKVTARGWDIGKKFYDALVEAGMKGWMGYGLAD